jgi:hypothetical protein
MGEAFLYRIGVAVFFVMLEGYRAAGFDKAVLLSNDTV